MANAPRASIAGHRGRAHRHRSLLSRPPNDRRFLGKLRRARQRPRLCFVALFLRKEKPRHRSQRSSSATSSSRWRTAIYVSAFVRRGQRLAVAPARHRPAWPAVVLYATAIKSVTALEARLIPLLAPVLNQLWSCPRTARTPGPSSCAPRPRRGPRARRAHVAERPGAEDRVIRQAGANAGIPAKISSSAVSSSVCNGAKRSARNPRSIPWALSGPLISQR